MKLRRSTLAVVAAGLLVTGTVEAQTGDNRQNTDAGNLGNQWWQLNFSLPTVMNPFEHEQACQLGQSGPTWFLYSTARPTETIGPATTDSCIVPSDKQIFLSLIATICIPDYGTTIKDNCTPPPELDTPQVAVLEIDGVDYSNLIERRSSNRPFTLVIPAQNPFDWPQGFFRAVHDGYYALLPPLSPGDHVVDYRAQVVASPDGDTVAFNTRHILHIFDRQPTLPPGARAAARTHR
jgi:hypothetical protein